MAARVSGPPMSGTVPIVVWVAGSSTSTVLPEPAAIHLPPIRPASRKRLLSFKFFIEATSQSGERRNNGGSDGVRSVLAGRGPDASCGCRFERLHDAAGCAFLAEMIEHHRAGPYGGDRIGDAEMS